MKEISILEKLLLVVIAGSFVLLSHKLFGFESAVLICIVLVICKLDLIYLRLHKDAETKSEEKES